MRNKGLRILLTILLILAVAVPAKITARAVRVLPFTSPLDYSIADNWLYDGAYPENSVDVFMVAPTVDTTSESNSTITPKYKIKFRNAMNQQQAISINPLNWRTDSTVASKKLNKGTVTQDSKTGAILSVEAGKYGAYIDPVRGSLIVTDIDISKYPKVLDIFPNGSLHLYDNFLFFVNLQENVQKRTESFIQKKALSDAA